MKKIVISLLALMLVLGSTALAQEQTSLRVGMLSSDVNVQSQLSHLQEVHGMVPSGIVLTEVEYSSLATLLLALRSGDVHLISLPKASSEYLVAHGIDLDVSYLEDEGEVMAAYSMLIKEENQQVYDAIEGAIQAMEQDGSLDDLIQSQLQAYIHSDPSPAEMPYIDGAPTIRVAVTGDIPPMDLVTVDGVPAGFNVALLTEIANHSQVNFELVAMEAGARLTALATGEVDVVFWSDSAYCEEHGFSAHREMDGVISTSPYFTDPVVRARLPQQ